MSEFDNMENDASEVPMALEEEVYETYTSIRSKKDRISFIYDVLSLGMETALGQYYQNNFSDADNDAGTPLLINSFVDLEYGVAHMILFKNNLLHISSNRKKIMKLCVSYLFEQGHILRKYDNSKYQYKFNDCRYNKTYELVGITPFISAN